MSDLVKAQGITLLHFVGSRGGLGSAGVWPSDPYVKGKEYPYNFKFIRNKPKGKTDRHESLSVLLFQNNLNMTALCLGIVLLKGPGEALLFGQ